MNDAIPSVNLFSAEFQSDPFPSYVRMREAGLYRIDPMGWIAVSRYADVQQVLRTPEQFSSTGFVEAFEPPWVGYNPGAHTMLSMDPPEHTGNRGLVNKAFTGAVLGRLEPLLRATINQLVQGMIGAGEVDFVQRFALPITAGALGTFLGLDPSLHTRFKYWSDTLAGVTPQPRDEAHVAEVKQVIAELTSYLTGLIKERRAQPGEDLVSVLVRAEVDGRSLDERELVAFLTLLLVAGLETTVHLVSKGALLLANRRDIHNRLRKDLSLVPQFVEEMLRWDPPTHSLFRVTTSDVEIGGGTIKAGSFVMVMLAAANRDPAVFASPEDFDLDRARSRHVAFGHGPHQCIGLALARLEARLAFEALVTQCSQIERTESAAPVCHTLTVRGPLRLPLRLHPA